MPQISSSSYPGKAACFEISETWKAFPGHKVFRQAVLTSSVADSLFSQLQILGLKLGSIAIIAKLNKQPDKSICQYFQKFEICERDAKIIGQSTTVSELFEILKQNNQFSSEALDLLQKLISAKDWRQASV